MADYRVKAYERNDPEKVWHPVYAHHRTGLPTFDHIASDGKKNLSVMSVVSARAAKRKYAHDYVVKATAVRVAPDVTGDRDVIEPLLLALQRAAELTKSEVYILSGGRTVDEQRYLYNGYAAGLPGFAPANPPGKSMHEYDPSKGETGGKAADAYIRGKPIAAVLSHSQLRDIGLKAPYAREPWHVELT